MRQIGILIIAVVFALALFGCKNGGGEGEGGGSYMFESFAPPAGGGGGVSGGIPAAPSNPEPGTLALLGLGLLALMGMKKFRK